VALKPNTPSRAKESPELVFIRATDGDTVIKVPQETAEMLLRSKGDYELVDEAGKKVGKKSGKKASAPDASGDDGGSTPAVATGSTTPVKPVWPAGTAEVWAEYARHLGIDPDGLDRSGIRDAVEAHEAKAAAAS
jgi:hypothetical protein